MTENIKNPAPESPAAGAPTPPASDPGVISLEDIDRFLEEDDPEFAMSLSDIVPEELGQDVQIESVDIDEKNLTEEEEDKAKKKQSILQRYPKVQGAVEKITAPIKALPHQALTLSVRVRNLAFDLARASWKFARHDLPELLKYSWSKLKAAGAWVQGRIQYFLAKPKLEKALYAGAALFILGFLSLAAMNIAGRWLPALFDDYVASMAEVADHSETYPPSEVEGMNDVFPQPTFTVLMEKIVVNLKRSVVHPNPMGAFQFYVSVDSQETAIEVKDREKEILDYVQRAVEELTYEEVNEPGGRTQIKSLVRAEINRVLNQGRVQDVFIEVMISKP
ncbi:MAG: flagellar basal body-associated FliL family protein [Bdellovibrionales bacterium]|nr:flagellar basal body-associated FliL family protein [Bdellovibrionales bacterium]